LNWRPSDPKAATSRTQAKANLQHLSAEEACKNRQSLFLAGILVTKGEPFSQV